MNFEEIKEILMLIDKTGLEHVKIKNKDIEIEISNKKLLDNNKLELLNNNKVDINKSLENDKFNNGTIEIDCRENIDEDLKNNKNINKKINNKNIIEEDKQIEIKAPLIGTYYSSPSPDKPCFVGVGDYVKKGDTLCIIEAMKLMNEIKSEVSGKIIDIKLENESIVEYGQVLFTIEED